jgi:cell well associated rhsD protein
MMANRSYTEVSTVSSQCWALQAGENAPAVTYADWLDVRCSTGDVDYNKKVCSQWQNDLGGGKKGTTIYSLLFRYFNRDHLGNVREVVSEKGEVKQINAYYPFGTPIYALGTNESQQRYKYNAKEFDELHGLNTYDYSARQYAPLLPMWDRVDPLAEKYYGVSPYAYCANNPVIFVDPDGRKFDFSKMTKGEY